MKYFVNKYLLNVTQQLVEGREVFRRQHLQRQMLASYDRLKGRDQGRKRTWATHLQSLHRKLLMQDYQPCRLFQRMEEVRKDFKFYCNNYL